MPSAIEKPRTATVTLKLDPSHRERLKSLAAAKQRTAHYLMKEAIDRYLTVEEAQLALLKSLDASIDHFETTGLHVSLDEIKTWATEVKSKRDTQLPTCHA